MQYLARNLLKLSLMRITWHPDFESNRPLKTHSSSPTWHKGAESPHPGIDKIEQEVILMASVATAELTNCRVTQGSVGDSSTFVHFLADMELFEGRFRSILLDPSLSHYQTARLNRIFRAYQQLRPVGQLRRHIEFPLLSITEHNNFIRMELGKAVGAVTLLGHKCIPSMREPGWAAFMEAQVANEQAEAQVQETRKRLLAVLSPGAFRAAQAALFALEVACVAFHGIAKDHSEILCPEAINKMGNLLPRALQY